MKFHVILFIVRIVFEFRTAEFWKMIEIRKNEGVTTFLTLKMTLNFYTKKDLVFAMFFIENFTLFLHVAPLRKEIFLANPTVSLEF